MAKNVKGLIAVCAALDIDTRNMPDRDQLGGLIETLCHEIDHAGLHPVPHNQIILACEACIYTLPLVPDDELTNIFKGFNAFDIADSNDKIRNKIRAKMHLMTKEYAPYNEMYARILIDAVRRGFHLKRTFELNHVMIYRSLERLARLRNLE